MSITERQFREWNEIHTLGAISLKSWYEVAYTKHVQLQREHDSEAGEDRTLKMGRPNLDPPNELLFEKWWVDTDDIGVRTIIVPDEDSYGSWGAELPMGALTGSVNPASWAEALWLDWREARTRRDAERKERIVRELYARWREFPDEMRAIVEGK